MAKILIKKLPEGFHIKEGKIVKKALGGMTTGDQSSYGLVTTTPLAQTTKFNDDNNKTVRYSLSSVPKEEANLEAEGGETVLTDLNNDGNFELYNISGPRHSKGGVPMYLPEQSFIYSDTPTMMFKGEELKPFGFTSKKGVTPASISKRYQLNDYHAVMENLHADDIMTKSSELMLTKNMMSLSKLAFTQEAKKKFEEGVPMATYPYLVSQGIDPVEFTQKIEQMTKQEAQNNMASGMSPEQQQKMLMLKQMIEQSGNSMGQVSQEDNSEGIDENLGGMRYGGGFNGLRHFAPGGENISNDQKLKYERTKLDPEFYNKLIKVADHLKVHPYELLIVMQHESNLDSTAPNQEKSGALGLIQFMPRTARNLGTSIKDLEKMSASKQLDYVEAYYLQNDLKPGAKAEEMYMTTFLPAFVNKPDDFVLGKKGDQSILYWEGKDPITRNIIYLQNKVFDDENKNYYTVGDIKDRMRTKRNIFLNDALNNIKSDLGVDLPKPDANGNLPALFLSDNKTIPITTTNTPVTQTNTTRKPNIISPFSEVDSGENTATTTQTNTPTTTSTNTSSTNTPTTNTPITNTSTTVNTPVPATTNNTINKEGYNNYIKLENLIKSKDPDFEKTLDKAYTYFKAHAADQGMYNVPSKEDVINNFLEYQKNNYVVSDLTTPEERKDKNLDKGAGTNKNRYTRLFFDKIKEKYPDVYQGYDVDEDVTKTNQLFFQSLYLADKENPNKYLKVEYDGPEDKGNWENNLGISKADGNYGNNTLNSYVKVNDNTDPKNNTQSGTTTTTATTTNPNTTTVNPNVKSVDAKNQTTTSVVGPEPGNFISKYNPPVLAPWLQDQLKANAIAQRKREMFMPWQPAVQQQQVDYVLEDPTRAIAANQEGFNTAAQALGAFAGPQSLSARLAQGYGKTMAANADVLAQVNSRNVGTINRGKQINAEYENAANQERAKREVKQYDDTQVVLQNYLNEKNFDREQYSDAMGNMMTNAANTYNLNTINPYYNIDPTTGGTIDQYNWRDFKPNNQVNSTDSDRDQRMKDIETLKNLGINPTPELLDYYRTGRVGKKPATSTEEDPITAQINALKQYNVPYQGKQKKGGDIKKYAVPFYTGRMGY